MLVLAVDHYARDNHGTREAFKPGAVFDASSEEISAESRRRFPRLVQRVEQTADEQLNQEMDDLASCDATADAMLAALEGQRFREGFERPLVGVRVAAAGIYGGGDIALNEAADRLTGGAYGAS